MAGRLAAFGERKDTLHADIRRAAELGMTTTEIANLAHMSWHGVAKILRGKDRPNGGADSTGSTQ